MTKQDATNLWNSIIGYGACQEFLGSEGNSGEFHDAKEFKKLERELEDATTVLREKFSEVTGWLPVYDGKQGIWELIKRKMDANG